MPGLIEMVQNLNTCNDIEGLRLKRQAESNVTLDKACEPSGSSLGLGNCQHAETQVASHDVTRDVFQR